MDEFELPAETQAQLDVAVKTALIKSVQTQLPEAFQSALGVNADGGISPVNADGGSNAVRRAQGMLFGGDVSEVHVGAMGDPYKAYTSDTRGAGYGMFLRAYAIASLEKNGMQGVKTIIEKWEKERTTPQGQRILKALNESNFAEGGAFVQEQFANEYTALLRNKTVVRAAGARPLPMPGGNLSIGEITSGATAGWVGENANENASELGTGKISLASKELSVVVPISKRLLRHSSIQFDLLVRDDALAAAKVAEDAAFLRSVGSQHRPKGLRWQIHANNRVNVNTTGSTALDKARLTRSALKLKLLEANIPMVNPVWIMSHRTEEHLFNLTDGNGNAPFEREMLTGKWGLFPYFASNQVPNNLNGSGDESELYLIDMFQVFIGDDQLMSIEIVENASYRDETGALVSAFDRKEILVNLIHSTDISMRYQKAGAVATDVDWGA